MQSPFPGMDPYIEDRRIWLDFHHDLASEIRADLNSQIPPGYYATAVTYVTYDVIEVAAPIHRSISPDISLWRPSGIPAAGGVATKVIDPPKALGVGKMEVPVRVSSVEVREAGSDMLITAIEILSPVNKRPGTERDKYLRKRRELLNSSVHVMEIDLLRLGERTPLETPLPPAPYYATLCRAQTHPYVEIWPIQLEDRLPIVPIPLYAPDPDVPLDLGEIVRNVYSRGRYSARINYQQPVPLPQLSPEQQVWLQEVVLGR